MSSAIGFPGWAREIQTLLPACSHFLVSGNVRDLCFGPPDGDHEPASLVELPALVERALSARGIRLVSEEDGVRNRRYVEERIGALADEGRHPQCRGDGSDGHDGDAKPPPAHEHEQKKEQRPEQVELLFDAERPEVAKQLGRIGREIA